jgi:hypothetical protein
MIRPPTWSETHQLFHYTTSPGVVGSILKNGFMLVPNRRNLINRLLWTKGFERREPQQFGMISFTELRRDEAAHHREAFGPFGIAVSWDWAHRHNAQRVIYMGEGPVMEAFSWLFRFGKQELERSVPEKCTEAHLNNKAVAGLYCQHFSHLLTLYEYMEPERNSSQVEWRIVNPLPHYHDLSDHDRLMKRLLDYASKGIDTIRIEPDDVECVVCPRGERTALREAIPKEYRDVPIIPYAAGSGLAAAVRAFMHRFEATLHGRIRPVIRVEPTLPAKSPAIREHCRMPGVFEVPTVKKLMGIAASTDPVLDSAYVSVQYEDHNNFTIDMSMPFAEAAKLMTYLYRMSQEPRFRSHFELLVQRLQNEKSAPKKPRSDATN